MNLGIIEECLCILPHKIPHKIWIMTKYNEKHSWRMMGQSQECELHHEVLRFFADPKYHLSYERNPDRSLNRTRNFICAPIFVPSLVSPHIHRKDGCNYKLVFLICDNIYGQEYYAAALDW